MKKLFVDLEKLNKCGEVAAKCSYYYHPKNSGITRLREIGQFLYICRHCEEAPCVNACPKEAIERLRKQIQLIDLSGIVDIGILEKAVWSCYQENETPFDTERAKYLLCDNGAFPEEPIIYRLTDKLKI